VASDLERAARALIVGRLMGMDNREMLQRWNDLIAAVDALAQDDE
jgi:hypothetical protein